METARTMRGLLKCYPGKRTQTPSSSRGPLSCWGMQERFYENGSWVQKNCASLVVHPKCLGTIWEQSPPKTALNRDAGYAKDIDETTTQRSRNYLGRRRSPVQIRTPRPIFCAT